MGIDGDDLFDDALVFDPTEPVFLDTLPIDPAAESSSLAWPAVLWSGSLLTSLALFARLLWQFALGRRLVQQAHPVEADGIRNALEKARARMGIRGSVQLLCSRDVCSPLIWCWRQVPALLVHKQTSDGLPRCDWVGIFCHELAHWRRLDHLTGLFGELLVCAAPWHPLLWWARGRLATLSEEACDDWVLAGGQPGVDYAESLLDLSPQAQMAFLPTVVGKEKAMKERIRRILKDRCGNPKAGMRWMLLVGAAALLTSATVALAQPGSPAPSDSREVAPAGRAQADRPARSRQLPPERREMALQGRRNVLNRMLENLRQQKRQAEASLQNKGDKQDDETAVLRSELATIENHIDAIERQLQTRDEPQAGPGAKPVGQRPAAEQRLLRVQGRIKDAEAKLNKLEATGQGDSEQAQKLRQDLRVAREQLRVAREQPDAARPNRERPAAQPARQPAPVRPQIQLQEQVQQLQNQMGDLNRQMEQVQRTLNRLVEQRPADRPQ
jgi:beta-lactamase regulating signal transducer with metallopeptidase domain